jgi:hypothetical protein
MTTKKKKKITHRPKVPKLSPGITPETISAELNKLLAQHAQHTKPAMIGFATFHDMLGMFQTFADAVFRKQIGEGLTTYTKERNRLFASEVIELVQKYDIPAGDAAVLIMHLGVTMLTDAERGCFDHE